MRRGHTYRGRSIVPFGDDLWAVVDRHGRRVITGGYTGVLRGIDVDADAQDGDR